MEKKLKKGLYLWYPFEKDARILVTSDNSIQSGEVYDYIIAERDIERADDPVKMICEYMSQLSEHGHLLLATENRFAMRYFCGDHDTYTNRNFDSIDGYRGYTAIDRQFLNGRLYAKYEIEEFLCKAGVDNYRFYSIFPGLDMPQHIISEKFVPIEEMKNRYIPLYNFPDSLIIEEGSIVDQLKKNHMLHQMADAYLIDISKDGSFFEFDAITTSLDRGRKKAMATIQQVGKCVKKQALYEEGKDTLATLVKNTLDLENRGVRVVPLLASEDGMSVTMPFAEGEIALAHLIEMGLSNVEQFLNDMDAFVDCIRRSSDESDAVENPELGPILEHGYIDMVPHNCFYIDGEFIFFDQEYVEENYPINVIIQRSLDVIYNCATQIEENVTKQTLADRYGLGNRMSAYSRLGREYIQKLRHIPDMKEFYKKHQINAEMGKNRLRINYSEAEYKKLFQNVFGNLAGKKLYLFGSGKWAAKYLANYKEVYEVAGIIDNNTNRWGEMLEGIPIMSLESLEQVKSLNEQIKVIICVSRFQPIQEQLEQLGIDNISIYNPNSITMDAFDAKEYLKKQGAIECDGCQSDSNSKIMGEGKSSSQKKYEVGYVAGVFDLFHIGHLNVLKRAKENCERLIVGVVSDKQANNKKRSTYISEDERLEIVRACKYVDEAFLLPLEASDTKDVYGKYHFDVQFSGSDYENDPVWLEKQEWLRERGSDLVFFPYTQSTSSTKLKSAIEKTSKCDGDTV